MRLNLFVLFLAVILWIYLSRLRNQLLDRMILIGLGIVSLCLLAMPDRFVGLVQWIGVERTNDLLIYIFGAAMGLLWFSLYTRVRKLEEQVTYLVRTMAIQQAHIPPSDESVKAN